MSLDSKEVEELRSVKDRAMELVLTDPTCMIWRSVFDEALKNYEDAYRSAIARSKNMDVLDYL